MKPTSSSFHPVITPRFLVEALGLTVPGISPGVSGESPDATEPFSTVTSDSRAVKSGCLFVALQGDKHDGHDFIESAVAQGARGVVCKRGFHLSNPGTTRLYAVEDTLTAFRRLAAAWRKEFSIPVIAVAGSVGKTTTKDLLSALLQGKWPEVLKTQGSQNGFVGIPITLLGLTPTHGAAVVEVGIDEMGAMKQHMQMLNATASVLTTIGPEHLEKLRDVPTVAQEEGIALISVATTGGTVAVNLDDPWIKPHANTLRGGKRILYSMTTGPGNDHTLVGKVSQDAAQLELSGMGMDGESLSMPLLGMHNARNLLAAVAVARGLGLTPGEIRKGLTGFKASGGRSEIRELPKGTPVVCDYYNANPSSMEAGISLLSEVSKKGGKNRRKWACLGDMLELGTDEERFHRELAGPLMTHSVDHVLLYGKRMRWLQEELQNKGFRGVVAHYEKQDELATALLAGVSPGEAILIKGSRSMKMEEVWKLLELHASKSWRAN